MSYKIPQQLEYKEKIMFGLTFRQLAFALFFGLPAFGFVKLMQSPVKWFIAGFLVLLALAFMFLNIEQFIKNWIAFLKFREAFLLTKKMDRYIGIEKIEKNIITTKNKRISIVKVEPINFIIKNSGEKEAVVRRFQDFLNSLVIWSIA